jgi:hypothetical protein
MVNDASDVRAKWEKTSFHASMAIAHQITFYLADDASRLLWRRQWKIRC